MSDRRVSEGMAEEVSGSAARGSARSGRAKNMAITGVFLVGLAAMFGAGAYLLLGDRSAVTNSPGVETSLSVNDDEADGRQLNCIQNPSRCGYPDESNTGVRNGLKLLDVPNDVSSGDGWHFDERGWVQVDGEGALLEGLELRVPLDVTADNVTIRNVRIEVYGETWGIALRSSTGTRIENVEISSPKESLRLLVGIKDIYGDCAGTEIIGSDISGVSTAIQTTEGLIQGNYLHDFRMEEGDHINGTTSNGSQVPLRIENNTILNQFSQTDAVSFFQDFGVEANRLVINNLLAGGGYTIYGGQNPGAEQASNIRVIGNRISPVFFDRGGFYGPVTAFDPAAPGNLWENNIWDDSGGQIPAA